MIQNLLLAVTLASVPSLALAQTDPAAAPVMAAEPGTPAAAEPAASPLVKESWPTRAVDRPLGLSQAMVQVDVPVTVGLDEGAAGKKINFPLVCYVGITDQLQATVLHGTGLCVTGKDHGCAGGAYDDLSGQLLYSLHGRGSSLELGAWTQFNVLSFSAGTTQLQAGGAINWVVAGGQIAILAYPNVAFGLSHRDTGNEEKVGAPVIAYFQVTDTLAPFLATGLNPTPFQGFADNVTVPVGIGALYSFERRFDVGARFDMPSLIGGDAASADVRSVSAFVSIRP